MGYLYLGGGEDKGRKIITPSGKKVRPMTGFLRKVIFDIVQERIPGSVVFDLFAGSGSLGFEALSRGASQVYFLEKDPYICSLLIRNIKTCGFENRARVLKKDFMHSFPFPSRGIKPDIVFVDPPFSMNSGTVLKKLYNFRVVLGNALIVFRHPEEQDPFLDCGFFEIKNRRKYGRSVLVFGSFKVDSQAG